MTEKMDNGVKKRQYVITLEESDEYQSIHRKFDGFTPVEVYGLLNAELRLMERVYFGKDSMKKM